MGKIQLSNLVSGESPSATTSPQFLAAALSDLISIQFWENPWAEKDGGRGEVGMQSFLEKERGGVV